MVIWKSILFKGFSKMWWLLISQQPPTSSFIATNGPREN